MSDSKDRKCQSLWVPELSARMIYPPFIREKMPKSERRRLAIKKLSKKFLYYKIKDKFISFNEWRLSFDWDTLWLALLITIWFNLI